MATVNIVVENDADFYRVFQYQTVSGVPINLTGAMMWMMLRRHAEDVTADLRLGTDTGEIKLTDPINGMFSVLISQAALEQLDLGAYDHSMIASLGGFKLNIWTGTLTNNAGASR